MSSSAPSPTTVLSVFDALDSPGTPLTTPEVAAEFDCTNRTIYNKLETLVDDGSIETKKVGARGRVWWQPPHERTCSNGGVSSVTPDEITERPEPDRALTEQRQLVEQIASGAPLEDCLSSLCTTVSALDSTVRASIVLTDDANQSFERCIAPDLSPAWRDELEGLPIDDRQIGTCGEAVFRGEPITCENVATTDKWADDWRELCLAHDIRAGHSVPIHDADGEPLGSVMLCFDEPKQPTEWEPLVNFGTDVASIAIEHDRSRRALRESEERYRTLFESVPVAAFVCDDAAIIQHYNRRAAELWGREPTCGDPDERYCGSQALYLPDGTRLPHEESPMVEVLQDGTPVQNVEVEMEQADGSRIPISASFSPVTDAQGDVTGVITTFEDITERKEREQRLERQREQIEELKDRLLDTSPTGILVVDKTGKITLANDRATDIFGLSREELVGLSHNAPELGIVDQHGDPLPDERLPVAQVRAAGDAIFGIDLGATRADGERIWLAVNAAPLDSESDDPTETVVAFEDITDHKQLNDALDHLNDASRELMNVERETITEQAASLARDVLAVEYTALWGYDEETGDLQRQTRSTTGEIDQQAIQPPDDFDERAWQAFISDEIDVRTDLAPATDSPVSTKSLQSDAIIPLGRHGIIYAGSTRPQTFDEATVDLAGTVAATVETALDRDDDEQQLEIQNTELTQLNQINDIIRDIDQRLVQAQTREEIDRLVCERLADAEHYECAWIGELEPGTDTVTPREWAGIDPGYLEGLEITTDDTPTGQGPVGTALRTRELQVVEDIVTDALFVPWREQTLAQDVRSCISVPLTYKDSLYGVLTVYAAQPLDSDGFGVLAELGETIGHAINAVETKQTLQTDSVVELGLQLREPDTVLSRLAQHASCTIEFEGLVPHADDPPTIFFTVHGASADEIQRLSTDAIEIASVTCLREREDSCLCKARIGGTTLPAMFIAQEAVIRSLTIEETTVSAIVDLAQAAEVRAFIDAIQAQFPTTDLISRRTHERSLAGGEERGRTAFEEGLTARQQEILRTAYLSGYFQSPRETTGQEIAAALDVSQPTFIQHLRASQSNLLTTLFEELD